MMRILMLLVSLSSVFLMTTGHEDEKSALIIIDVQNCFLKGGTLAVKDGNDVIPVIKKIRSVYRERFSLVVMTQDWHCSDHVSFASQHQGHGAYSEISLEYDDKGNLCKSSAPGNTHALNCTAVSHRVQQTLWPDHCVINTTDAEFSRELTTDDTDFIVRKGYHCQVDSYSAFYDNGGFSQTELHDKLQQQDIKTVYVTGLARDYCVFYTAKDALKLGYKTFVILDATRGVAEATSVAAVNEMKNKGISLIDSGDVGLYLPPKPTAEDKTAFLIIDIQNCFLPGGSLAVTNGDQVIPVINEIRSKVGHKLDLVVLSQDWHCADHVSFASQHEKYNQYDVVTLSYNQNATLCRTQNITNKYAQPCSSVSHQVSQTLWPDHCVINTTGAEFSTKLDTEASDVIVKKGYRCQIDSYSVFYDNGGFTQTELNDLLQKNSITTVYVVGLATDFCVYNSALDARRLGYKTSVVQDACRGVTPEGSTNAVNDMKSKGISVIDSNEMINNLIGGPASTVANLQANIQVLLSLIFAAYVITRY